MPWCSCRTSHTTAHSAITDDNARLDIAASGFWEGRFERAFFDMRVFNLYAPQTEPFQQKPATVSMNMRRDTKMNGYERLSMPPLYVQVELDHVLPTFSRELRQCRRWSTTPLTALWWHSSDVSCDRLSYASEMQDFLFATLGRSTWELTSQQPRTIKLFILFYCLWL